MGFFKRGIGKIREILKVDKEANKFLEEKKKKKKKKNEEESEVR